MIYFFLLRSSIFSFVSLLLSYISLSSFPRPSTFLILFCYFSLLTFRGLTFVSSSFEFLCLKIFLYIQPSDSFFSSFTDTTYLMLLFVFQNGSIFQKYDLITNTAAILLFLLLPEWKYNPSSDI